MKKYFTALLVTVFFLITLASLPRVDNVEPSVFFYLGHLPLIYYLCLLVSLAVALFSRQKLTRVLSVCVTALLIVWTPSVMLVQPWHLDSYPFVAEPVYVARNGHLGDIHCLSKNPALGLTFGPFLLVTGISPFTLLKVFPAFLSIFFVVFVYMITSKLKLGAKASIIASLLFISIFWPDVFHFSRFGFSLTYYFVSLFLLIRLVFQGFDRRIFALLPFLIISLAISHEATPLFFMFNLAGMIVLAQIFRTIKPKEVRLLSYALTTSLIAWLLWNMIGTNPGVIYSLRDIISTVVTSLMENPSQVSGISKITGGYTRIYDQIIYLRLALTLVVYLASFLIPIIMYRRFKDKKLLLILTAWAWSNMSITVPLLYAGLPYFQKPAVFAIVSWGPIAAIFFSKTSFSKIKSIARIFLVIFIIVSSLLIPLIKCAPLPMEYPSTQELVTTTFLGSYGSQRNTLMYFEDQPYLYFYTLHGYEPPLKTTSVWAAYIPGEGLNSSIIEGTSLWVMYRLSVRDAFTAVTPSWTDVIKNVTAVLPATTHNKVYDSGWPECILTPRNQP